MATSAQVADAIRDLDTDFDDAETLHQNLVNLHEIIAATQEVLQRTGDKVAETPLNKAGYSDAIHEAAGNLSGVADQLQQVVGGGVLQG